MGLEIRKAKNGKLIKHWYASFVDANGRRRVVALTESLPSNMPNSLKEAIGPAYETSRGRAQKELDVIKADARKKGRDNNLTKKLIESKTNQEWKDTPLEALPGFTRTMKGKRSEAWKAWQVLVIGRFVKWAKKRGHRTVIEITPSIAEDYIESLKELDEHELKRTAGTMRSVKSTISLIISKKLPEGMESPFKKIKIETEEGEEIQHRTALSPNEVNQLLTVAESDRFIYPLFVTALCTGLRRGDVCRLRWSNVDLTPRESKLIVKTSKTKEEVQLPILPRLQEVLEAALTERKPGAVFVFPEAEYMIENNPSGISYRVKKTFVRAFAKPEEAAEVPQDTPEIIPLKEVLPQVLDAVEGADITETKRAKMIDLLKLYASCKSYRIIKNERGIQKPRISEYMHEAERLSGLRFIPEVKRGGIKQAVKELTRHKRADGMRDASKYDFHALRTTFVTLALSGKNPMPVEKVIALTGHRVVETVMKYYFKPKGTDYRKDLERAMPKTLTEGKGVLPQPQKIDRVEALAEQYQNMTESERARFGKILIMKGGTK